MKKQKKPKQRIYICEKCGNEQLHFGREFQNVATHPRCQKCKGQLLKKGTYFAKVTRGGQDSFNLPNPRNKPKPNKQPVFPVHDRPMEAKMSKYGWFFICPVVGCTMLCGNQQTSTPADKETRQLRMQCHDRIDPLWRDGKLTRTEIYDKMAEHLGLQKKDTHIGFFNSEQCMAVLDLVTTLEMETEGVPMQVGRDPGFSHIPNWEEVPVFQNDYGCENLV